MSTHLDKGHLHNHIVVNSVSFMDGKMFRNDFKTYYQGIRKVSDDLCRQNQLSVIETDGRGISYGEWRNRREGKPTLRGMVKADVEMALAETLTILSASCKRWAMRSSTVPASSTWQFGTKTAKGLCGWTVLRRSFPRRN